MEVRREEIKNMKKEVIVVRVQGDQKIIIKIIVIKI
jgi:hypothetical protein